jgi:hypothetical protein
MQKPEFNKVKFLIKRYELDIDKLSNKDLNTQLVNKNIISLSKLLQSTYVFGENQKIEDMYITLDDCEPELIYAYKSLEYKQHLIDIEKYKIWEAEQKIKELEQE